MAKKEEESCMHHTKLWRENRKKVRKKKCKRKDVVTVQTDWYVVRKRGLK